MCHSERARWASLRAALLFALPGCGAPDEGTLPTAIGTQSVARVAPVAPVGDSGIASTSLSHAEWRKAMSETRTPKDGCFRASHPDTTWKEVPCAKAHPRRHFDPVGGLVPRTVGSTNGDDTL